MLGVARSPGGNDRNFDGIGDRLGQFEVVTRLGTISIHTRDEQFPSAPLGHFLRPAQGINAGIFAASPHINIPTRICRIWPTSGVNRHHNALIAKPFGCFIDKIRVPHRRRIDTDFIGPGPQEVSNLGRGTDATADGEGNKDLFCGLVDHIDNGVAVFVGGGNVEENQFVSPRIVINLRQLYRIASILEIDKIHTFDNPSSIHIEARQNSFGEHFKGGLLGRGARSYFTPCSQHHNCDRPQEISRNFTHR
ncbi:hypothetical protein SYNPCC7002_A1635 [Picosynechococcus sp. PCC 7002]|nr:hypothetical protein SYNPCC7002_A1635 [Picosynechococcus sp. PCC 7002]